MKKNLEDLEKQSVLRILTEFKDEKEMTSGRMLSILNEVRKSGKIAIKKNCSANRQKVVELVRKVIGEYLCERSEYSHGFGKGRQPSKYYIESGDYENAVKAAMMYFEKCSSKVVKAVTAQKRASISKILVILQKIEEAPDCTVKLDVLKELIDVKSSVNLTLQNWKKMLGKEGITLKFQAMRGIYKFDLENVREVKTKLESVYGKLSEESKKTKAPKITSIPEKELTTDEEKVIYLLAKITNRKPVPNKDIWTRLKQQGLSGFDFSNLIRRAGLKKWFRTTRNPIPGGFEYCYEFTGDIQAVASLMDQETEKIYLIRSSLDESQMKTCMKSNNNFRLLNAKPGDNLYELRCSDHESKVRIALLSMGFRGYDSFIYEDDAKEINELKNQILESYLKNED